MLLAFDTSTAACTAALFDAHGECIARKDEMIGRGHAERLVPMIAELLDGRIPESVLVGVGPGSFTGIRVGIAAAHGLAIGWGANLAGMSSLALLAASAAAGGETAAASNAIEIHNTSPNAGKAAGTDSMTQQSGAKVTLTFSPV